MCTALRSGSRAASETWPAGAVGVSRAWRPGARRSGRASAASARRMPCADDQVGEAVRSGGAADGAGRHGEVVAPAQPRDRAGQGRAQRSLRGDRAGPLEITAHRVRLRTALTASSRYARACAPSSALCRRQDQPSSATASSMPRSSQPYGSNSGTRPPSRCMPNGEPVSTSMIEEDGPWDPGPSPVSWRSSTARTRCRDASFSVFRRSRRGR